MTDPKALLVAGDTHQNPNQILYLFQEALNQDVDAIFQVGDFGYFEHFGGEFCDLVGELAVDNDMPFYWIDGNHENHVLLREKYADSEKTPEGFWTIRKGLYYVPRGTRWTWNGQKMLGFGGAISIDKDFRLQVEREGWVRKDGTYVPPTGDGTQWWPEEEQSMEEFSLALGDRSPVDVMFTHDKPRASNTPHKDLPMLWPSQEKIQILVQKLKPKLLIHGHLHHRYTDQIRCGDDGQFTRVEGLDCDKTGQKSWVRLALR